MVSGLLCKALEVSLGGNWFSAPPYIIWTTIRLLVFDSRSSSILRSNRLPEIRLMPPARESLDN